MIAPIVTAVTLTVVADADAQPSSIETPSHSETPYCQRVVADAEAQASLLFAPTATVQIVRFPEGAIADSTGAMVGHGLQPRASLAWDLIGLGRGAAVLDVAEADCLRQAASVTLFEALALRDAPVRKVALERRLALVRSRTPEVDAIVRKAEERFAAGTATLLELHEIRRLALAVSADAAATESTLSTLEARGAGRAQPSIEAGVRDVERHSMDHRERQEHLENLAPWRLELSAGVALGDDAVPDWFGVAGVSYVLGGPFQQAATSRATDARARELATARYEVRAQAAALREDMARQAVITATQLALVDRQLLRTRGDLEVVAAADAPTRAHVLSALTLETIRLEAERVTLATLVAGQRELGGLS